MRNPATAHWRDSARRARFFMVDAFAIFPLLLLLMHIRLWTFILAVTAVFFFATLEKFGFTIPVFFRWFRVFLGGNIKSSRPWWERSNRYE